jgi:hypothetical protein
MQGAVVVDSFTVAFRSSDADDVLAATVAVALGRVYAAAGEHSEPPAVTV